MLQTFGGLHDTFASFGSVNAESPDLGITCDSPKNTWTACKHLDERALRHSGKRLDYILFRGPTPDTNRLRCTQHKVVMTEPIRSYGVSYSDHFGVAASFEVKNTKQSIPLLKDSVPDVLGRSLPLLQNALRQAYKRQRRSCQLFAGLLTSAIVLVAGNVCSAAWLLHGRTVAPSLVTALMLIPVSWAGTTALYDGVVWGEWLKRTWKHTDNRHFTL